MEDAVEVSCFIYSSIFTQLSHLLNWLISSRARPGCLRVFSSSSSPSSSAVASSSSKTLVFIMINNDSHLSALAIHLAEINAGADPGDAVLHLWDGVHQHVMAAPGWELVLVLDWYRYCCLQCSTSDMVSINKSWLHLRSILYPPFCIGDVVLLASEMLEKIVFV